MMNFKASESYKYYRAWSLPPFDNKTAREFFPKTKTDPAAREEFFRRNIRLALDRAEKYYYKISGNPRFEPDELIQVALLALDHQIDSYNPDMAAFSTYYCGKYVSSKFRDLLKSAFYQEMNGVVSLDSLIDSNSDREWNTRTPDSRNLLEEEMSIDNVRLMMESELEGDDLIYAKEAIGFDDNYDDYGAITVSEIVRRHGVTRYKVQKSLDRSYEKLRSKAQEYEYVS